jgi:hypothetical protein
MFWMWVFIGFIAALIILSIFLKMTKLMFRVLSIFLFLIMLLGAIFAIMAYVEGQALSKGIAHKPLLILKNNGTYVSAGIPSEKGVDIIDVNTLSPTLSYPQTVTVIIDATALQGLQFSDESEMQFYFFLIAMNQTISEQGGKFMLWGYLDGVVEFVPEPLSFKIMRTQKVVPVRYFLNKPWFAKVIGLETS